MIDPGTMLMDVLYDFIRWDISVAKVMFEEGTPFRIHSVPVTDDR